MAQLDPAALGLDGGRWQPLGLSKEKEAHLKAFAEGTTVHRPIFSSENHDYFQRISRYVLLKTFTILPRMKVDNSSLILFNLFLANAAPFSDKLH